MFPKSISILFTYDHKNGIKFGVFSNVLFGKFYFGSLTVMFQCSVVFVFTVNHINP
jgi:hypothetical protein